MLRSRSRSRHALRLATAALAVFTAGCGPSRERPDPLAPCPEDVTCPAPTGGGVEGGAGGGATTGTGAGGAGEAVDVTVTVVAVVTPGFDQTQPHGLAARIHAPAAGGGFISVDFDPTVGGVSLTGVASGPVWMLVEDATGGASSVLSTYSFQELFAQGSYALPVVQRALLEDVAFTLPSSPALLPGRAHLVLSFIRENQALAGVVLTNPPPGATIAYDVGPGFYAETSDGTGEAGTLLVLNASTGSSLVSVVDASGTPFTLQVPVGADTVTFAGFEL